MYGFGWEWNAEYLLQSAKESISATSNVTSTFLVLTCMFLIMGENSSMIRIHKTLTLFFSMSMTFIGFVPFAFMQAAEEKPVLLYSRYFNAQGENRYAPEGTYSDILKFLSEKFTVRSHGEPLQASQLHDVAVVLIANPSDAAFKEFPAPPHCSPADVKEITAYVENGGGFIIMENQENHNLETTAMNKLLENFGLQFTDTYTDAKALRLSETTPIIGASTWAYYTGNQITLMPDHAAKPKAVVNNDLNQHILGGSRDVAGVLLASATPGKGRVIAVTDSGWIINNALNGKGIGKVAIKEQDNAAIFMRLCLWCAGK